MDLSHLLWFHAAINGVNALVSLPLALGMVPTNPWWGYRVGDYRTWTDARWRRVNRVLGVRMAWGCGLLALLAAGGAWYVGEGTPRRGNGLMVVPILLLLAVVAWAAIGARREAARP